MTRYKNLDDTSVFSAIANARDERPHLRDLLNSARLDEYICRSDLLTFFYSTTHITNHILDLFQQLADEQCVIDRFLQLLRGERMNTSEERPVSHHLTRAKGHDDFYSRERRRVEAFVHGVHSGVIKNVMGKPFRHVVQVGIGGSDLGPRAVYDGLRRYVEDVKGDLVMDAHFISNIDPDDALSELSELDLSASLFLVVSKSGTTLETLANMELIKERFKTLNMDEDEIKSHFVAVTGKGSLLDDPSSFRDIFYIDDAIGGRFSVSSAVGATLLS